MRLTKQILTAVISATILLTSVPAYAAETEADVITDAELQDTAEITDSASETIQAESNAEEISETAETSETDEISIEIAEETPDHTDTETDEITDADAPLEDTDELMNSGYSIPVINENGECIITAPTRNGGTYTGDANARLADNSAWKAYNFMYSRTEMKRMRAEAQRIVNELITDDMSDLEKYWTLFFKGPYFQLNHSNCSDLPAPYNNGKTQYTPIGLLGFNKNTATLCQGKTMYYMELCYAANLPCYPIFAPNHVYCYIPNINGKDYAIDNLNWFLRSMDGAGNLKADKRQFDTIDLSDDTFEFNYDPEKYYGDGTFDEWWAEVKAKNPGYVDYGSTERGKHYAKIPDNFRTSMEEIFQSKKTVDNCNGPWFGPLAKSGEDLILNVGSSYTIPELSEANAADYILKERLPIFRQWGLYEDAYSVRCTYNTSEYGFLDHKTNGVDHNCLEEGCISFDKTTGTIKVLKPLDKNHYQAEPNMYACVGDDYDASKTYIMATLYVEVGKCDGMTSGYYTQDIFVPFEEPEIIPVPTPDPDDPDPDPVDPNEPSFIRKRYSIYFDEELKADEVLNGIMSAEYELTCSNPNIASVDSEGNITGNEGGSGILYLYKGDRFLGSAQLTVYQPKLSGPTELTAGGKEGEYSVTNEITGYSQHWVCSDESVLKIDRQYSNQLFLKPLKEGTVTLSVNDKHGNIHSVEITVHSKPEFTVKSANLNVGQNFLIDDDILNTFHCEMIEYASSNTSVVKVNDFYLVPVATGKAVITSTATTTTGDVITSTMNVTVYNPVLSGVSDMYLDGKTSTFKVSGGLGTTVWSSSDPSVLTVNNKGTAKGISGGTADVIAVNNGKTMKKTVTVHRIPRLINSTVSINLDQTLTIDDSVVDLVDIDPAKVTYTLGKTKAATLSGKVLTPITTGKCTVNIQADTKKFTLKVVIANPALVAPDIVYTNNKTVGCKITSGYGSTIWSSSEPDILSVTDKGVIKGLSKGYSTLTAVNNGRTLTKNIYVCPIPRFLSKSTDINLDQTLTLDGALFDDADIGDAVFTVNNNKVAVINGNKLEPVKTGSVTLTATLNSKRYTTKINIFNPSLSAPNVVYMNNKKVGLKILSGVKATSWTSSDPDVLSITNKGVVRGLSKGHSVITAVNNGRILTKDIYVCPVPKFNCRSVVINNGETLDLDNVYFNDEGIGNTVYSVGRTTAASIDENNILTGLDKGRVTVTALCDGKRYSMTVNVFAPSIKGTDSLLLNNKTATLKIDKGNGRTEWSTDDDTTVSINSKGVIKGLKKGHATITAVNNGRTMTQTVYVYNVPSYEKLYVTNIDKPIYVKLVKDEDMPEPVYSVSNTKVATIDENGLLTPKKTGSITVTANAKGYVFKTTVKIFDPVIKCTDTVRSGKRITASVRNGYGPTTWSSDNPGIADISEKGVIIGNGTGTAVITATNNGRTMTKTVTVTP